MIKKNIELIQIIADEGKVFKRIEDGTVLGNSLWLGIKDSMDNYEEIDEPNKEETEVNNG